MSTPRLSFVAPLRAAGTSLPACALAALLGGSTLLGAGRAQAHAEDDPNAPPERTSAPTYDPAKFRSNQYGALELRFGPYRPSVDAEFGGDATPFEDLFGTGPSVAFGLEADWQILRLPHLASLGVGLGWSFVNYSADSLRAADPSERLPHPSRLWLMPMHAVAVLRVDVFARELSIPIVPYAKGGFALGLWNASDAGETSFVGEVEGKGLETGLLFLVGGMLHLNWFAPQAALDMDNSTGVNHAYLFFEWMASDLDSFDSGMQLGTSTWVTGVAFEY